MPASRTKVQMLKERKQKEGKELKDAFEKRQAEVNKAFEEYKKKQSTYLSGPDNRLTKPTPQMIYNQQEKEKKRTMNGLTARPEIEIPKVQEGTGELNLVHKDVPKFNTRRDMLSKRKEKLMDENYESYVKSKPDEYQVEQTRVDGRDADRTNYLV